MTSTSQDSRIEAVRAELRETLDAIDDKFNVPKQLGIARVRAQTSWESNPIPWIIGAAAAVIAIGGIITWAIVKDN